jgi:hypothetical protein
MVLEEKLASPLSHSSWYRLSNEKTISFSDLVQNDSFYVIDTSVLSCPIRVLNSITREISQGKGYLKDSLSTFENLCYHVTSMNELLSANRIVTPKGIFYEFMDSLPYFNSSFEHLQRTLEYSDYLEKEFHDLQEILLNEVDTFKKNMLYSVRVKENQEIKNIINDFKKTPSYVPTLKFLNDREKQVSDRDIFMYVFATYYNTFGLGGNRVPISIVSADIDFLAQGPIFQERFIFNSPQILFSKSKPYGLDTTLDNFKCFKHPDIDEKKIAA